MDFLKKVFLPTNNPVASEYASDFLKPWVPSSRPIYVTWLLSPVVVNVGSYLGGKYQYSRISNSILPCWESCCALSLSCLQITSLRALICQYRYGDCKEAAEDSAIGWRGRSYIRKGKSLYDTVSIIHTMIVWDKILRDMNNIRNLWPHLASVGLIYSYWC